MTLLAAREEPGSSIVFVSSAASLRAATGIPAYDASKAALLGICRQATAWEVAYATIWLLSAESSYVNAHLLILDGGATGFA
ncbi:MAG: SDR family NAD(P)-dependent oxidoreductase [Streptosporangiaceae bacterium]|jgi:short-subunit dehydrogenase involved in D-alanine esterification of teichoic acids